MTRRRVPLYALARDGLYLAEDGSMTASPTLAMKRRSRARLFADAEKVGARIETFTLKKVRGRAE